MSIPVELASLAEVMERYRFAYLLTNNADAAPHAVAVMPALDGAVLVLDGVGRRSRENLLAQPAVGLLWPPHDVAEYSLIVDGQAAMDGDRLRITPTRALLHRPARRLAPTGSGHCGSDCSELPVPPAAEPLSSR